MSGVGALREGVTDNPSGCHDAAPPPLVLMGPDGQRVTVAVPSTANTVGDLADSLGLLRRSDVLIDGRQVERRLPLDRVEITHGSRLTERAGCREQGRRRNEWPGPRPNHPALDSESATADRVHGVEVVIEAGPAAGSTIELGPGRHVLGRAFTAGVRIDDELVEMHHAIIDVDGSGAATFTQLAGRVPCRASTAPDSSIALAPLELAAKLPLGSVLTIGASRIRLRHLGPDHMIRSAALTPLRGDPWRRTIHRPPRSLPHWDPSPIDVPVEGSAGPARAGGLLAAVLSVVGGVVVALVMRNPMFLVFSAVGFLVAVGSRLGGRASDRKQRKRRAGEAKRARERFAEEVAEQRSNRLRFHRSIAPTIEATLAAARSMTDEVWSRRASHDDAFTVAVGWGSESWTVCLGPGSPTPEADAIIRRAQRLDDEPVLAGLGNGQSLAVVGPPATGVARSFVVQLATWTGPADWRLLVVVDDVEEWEWCRWLPHTSSGIGSEFGPTVVAADDGARLNDVLGRLDDGDERHVLVVTDRADLLSTRTGPLRRYLGSAGSVAVVAVAGERSAVPSMCRSLLEVGSLGQARWCPDTSVATSSSSLHAAGVSVADAADAARRLARLHDPEDPFEAVGATPATVALSTLMTRAGRNAVDDAIAIAAGWRSSLGAERGDDGGPRAAVGLTADGVVEIDLVRDGPHVLIAGTTGSGKSELLRTLVVSLAAGCSPDELTFVLIDYKGGSTFDACADLPHTVGVVTDLDDRLAERALMSLDAEIRRRERLLRDTSADNLEAYRVARPGSPLPRLVVVIDEFATMATELPGFLSALVGVAQRGRSLGIHLVLATQRPAGVVSDDIRANTNLRIALRLQDRSDAVDIVGDPEPSTFARGTPGRAMMRLGPGETLVFQTAHSSGRHQPAGDGGLRVVRLNDMARATPGLGDADVGSTRAGSAGAGEPTSVAGATELVVLARSIRGAASLCDIEPPFRPWLEPLSDVLGPDDLTLDLVAGVAGVAGVAATDDGPSRRGAPDCQDVVGIIDDPGGQRRLPLRWQLSDGNLALVGSFGSGTTTALKSALVAAGGTPHVYVLDARGDGRLDELRALATCGGVVSVHDAERRSRLLRMLEEEMVARHSSASSPARRRPLVVAVDGLSALNAALSGPGDMDEHARLVRILADGVGAGIHAVATFERPGAVPASMLASFGQRWLFHLDDPLDASGLGVKAAMTPPAIPGRILVTATRLEAQVAVLPIPVLGNDTVDASPSQTAATETPPPAAIGTLPDDIDAARLPTPDLAADGSTGLVLGIDFATLVPTTLDVPDGEHAIILGPARSGRSTALIRAIASWRASHAEGEIVVRCPRRDSPVLDWVARVVPDAVVAHDEASVLAAITDDSQVPERRVLIAVDDAERVDDVGGGLLGLVNARHAYVTVVAAGRPDTLRAMYGHWTAVVRRSRLGLVMALGTDSDGELLGEMIPRRGPVSARPGLAWLFDANGRRLMQVARDAR